VHFRVVVKNAGLLLIVTSASVLVIAAWSCCHWLYGETYEEHALKALMMTVAVGGLAGAGLWFIGRRGPQAVGRREAILLVASSWFIAAAISALPYRLWAAFDSDVAANTPFSSFVDCYFEAMSGLTTTGATVLSDIEVLPRSILLWRATTHWLGGLGIVVLFVAVLPMLGVGGKRLFRVESPGPTPEGVTPRIQETARMLWMVYVGLTILEIIALRIAGLDWFESVCHTFATLATGGFSTLNSSLGGYRSTGVDIIVIVFMIAAGVNFGLYYQLIRRRWSAVLTDPELRCYLGVLAIGSLIVTLSILNGKIVTTDGTEMTADLATAARFGVFQAVSVQTTTGFCTADFDQWNFVAKATMLVLMFVGGSAGSTGGGIKVIRCIMVVKTLWAELERVFHPNVVRPVRVGKATIDSDMKLGTLVYVLGVILLTVFGAAALMITERNTAVDATTAFTAVVATLNNIGPGLDRVGAVCNYGWFSDAGKSVMVLLMALGRLEVLTIAVLFFPRFWRTD
jgi:trk/ktr system potassium uptake protein